MAAENDGCLDKNCRPFYFRIFQGEREREGLERLYYQNKHNNKVWTCGNKGEGFSMPQGGVTLLVHACTSNGGYCVH